MSRANLYRHARSQSGALSQSPHHVTTERRQGVSSDVEGVRAQSPAESPAARRPQSTQGAIPARYESLKQQGSRASSTAELSEDPNLVGGGGPEGDIITVSDSFAFTDEALRSTFSPPVEEPGWWPSGIRTRIASFWRGKGGAAATPDDSARARSAASASSGLKSCPPPRTSPSGSPLEDANYGRLISPEIPESPTHSSDDEGDDDLTALKRQGTKPVETRRWMASPHMRELSLWDATYPATHNSATWRLNSTSVLSSVVAPFCLCQNLTILEQLEAGVRFLDLRVCRGSAKQGYEPFCAHGGLQTVPLREVLMQIHAFLKRNPTELLLLSVRKDARRVPRGLEVFESDFWICHFLAPFLGPQIVADATIGSLVSRGQQVIYFWHERERYVPTVEAIRSLATRGSWAERSMSKVLLTSSRAIGPQQPSSMSSFSEADVGFLVNKFEHGSRLFPTDFTSRTVGAVEVEDTGILAASSSPRLVEQSSAEVESGFTNIFATEHEDELEEFLTTTPAEYEGSGAAYSGVEDGSLGDIALDARGSFSDLTPFWRAMRRQALPRKQAVVRHRLQRRRPRFAWEAKKSSDQVSRRRRASRTAPTEALHRGDGDSIYEEGVVDDEGCVKPRFNGKMTRKGMRRRKRGRKRRRQRRRRRRETNATRRVASMLMESYCKSFAYDGLEGSGRLKRSRSMPCLVGEDLLASPADGVVAGQLVADDFTDAKTVMIDEIRGTTKVASKSQISWVKRLREHRRMSTSVDVDVDSLATPEISSSPRAVGEGSRSLPSSPRLIESPSEGGPSFEEVSAFPGEKLSQSESDAAEADGGDVLMPLDGWRAGRSASVAARRGSALMLGRGSVTSGVRRSSGAWPTDAEDGGFPKDAVQWWRAESSAEAKRVRKSRSGLRGDETIGWRSGGGATGGPRGSFSGRHGIVIATPLLAGKTRITKSWGMTCDATPEKLCGNLVRWAKEHGDRIPRHPYIFKVLAGEITAVTFDRSQVEALRYWTKQALQLCLKMPVGLRAAAEKTNGLLATEVLDKKLLRRVNVVSHDFADPVVIQRVIHSNFRTASRNEPS